MAGELHAPTGHVFRLERARGPIWYAKYRLPDGRQVQKRIGPAWTGRGRPAAGYVTKRLAEDWLRELLEEARRGTLPGMVRTGATFADAAAEWLRYMEHDRMRKPSTVATYRSLLGSQILPTFGDQALRAVRACMAVISVGYEEQAVGYTRLVAELVAASRKVVADHSGEYASRWLKGRTATGSKLADQEFSSESRDHLTPA